MLLPIKIKDIHTMTKVPTTKEQFRVKIWTLLHCRNLHKIGRSKKDKVISRVNKPETELKALQALSSKVNLCFNNLYFHFIITLKPVFLYLYLCIPLRFKTQNKRFLVSIRRGKDSEKNTHCFNLPVTINVYHQRGDYKAVFASYDIVSKWVFI